MYWRRPLTRMEMALSAAVVAVVMAVFLGRLLDYMELAERSNMETTVSYINSGINTGLAYDMLEGRPVNIAAGLKRNPFELARMSPVNFLGEVSGRDLASLEKGSWTYDRMSNELIYLPKLRRGLHTEDPYGAIRFRLVETKNKASYMLVPTSAYTWE
jgi:hypothetical protein